MMEIYGIFCDNVTLSPNASASPLPNVARHVSQSYTIESNHCKLLFATH